MTRTYTTEFPDFDPATMPDVPDTWEDVSWHNDNCPSFMIGDHLLVFVDHVDPAQRLNPETRYQVMPLTAGQYDGADSLMDSDDWAEVLAFVAAREALADYAAAYEARHGEAPCVEMVGRNRFRITRHGYSTHCNVDALRGLTRTLRMLVERESVR